MFKQRLISGIILVLIAAFGLYMGGIVTFAMTLIVALIGYSEILKIYHIEKSSLAVIGYTGTILYYVALLFDLDQWTTAIIILFLIFLLGCYVVRFPKYKVDQMMAGFFGFVYVAVMMSFIYQIRELQNGGEFVVLLFLAAWGNDTLAYCTGIFLVPCTNRIAAPITNNKNTTSIINIIRPPLLFATLDTTSCIKASGKRAIIPIKIINEIPLPIPLSVILSPSHK